MNMRTLMLGAIAGWALRGMVEEAEAREAERQAPLTPEQARLVREALERGQQVVTQRVGNVLRFLVDEGLGELGELFRIPVPADVDVVIPAPAIDRAATYADGDIIDVEVV